MTTRTESESELEDDVRAGVKIRGRWDHDRAHAYYDGLVKKRIKSKSKDTKANAKQGSLSSRKQKMKRKKKGGISPTNFASPLG